MCKTPGKPPQAEGEGKAPPGDVGRAQNALYARTQLSRPRPPRQGLDARILRAPGKKGALRKGGPGAHGAL